MAKLLSRLPRLPRLPIVPTERAAWLVAGFAPVALVIAALAPDAWQIVPIASLVFVVLIAIDALLAGRVSGWQVEAQSDVEIGADCLLSASATFSSGQRSRVDVAVEFDPRLGDGGKAEFTLTPQAPLPGLAGSFAAKPSRRGTAALDRAWLRWAGPLGLGANQISQQLDQTVRIWPDLSPVRSPVLQMFLRDAEIGLIARRIRGEGTQFEALSEYEPGMDRRRIDWKASARHTKLYARENESERNNQIVFAFDCGQAMCEPVDGMPRIDRAVSAALTCAYVALKGGDKTALFGFGQRPQLMTPFVSDARGFHRLQSAAAELDYTSSESNFTLALATLTSKLQRRALIVLFSDFSDPTAAELMIESIGRLVSKHLVLFVTITDSELGDFLDNKPEDVATLARSVTADTLLHQRNVVLQRLRQMGVDVVEAPWDQVGPQLIDHYFAIRNREAIG